MTLPRVLVVGFGNPYRRDDGVGPVVVRRVREALGLAPLEELEDGFERLGGAVDTLLLHQLVPELADTLRAYGLVIFVDAHVESLETPIYQEWLDADYTPPMVSHHFHPKTLLALTRELYGAAPQALLISVRGHDFDFGEGLSPHTAPLAEEAAQRVLAQIRAFEDGARRGE